MKTTKMMSILALGALACSAQAATLPPSLTFDGYCDGLTGITAGSGGVVTATWDLSACDLASTPAVGKSSSSGVAGFYDVAAQGLGFTSFLAVINNNGTWAYYDTAGNLSNFGTWSAGAAVAGTRPQRVSASK